MKCRCCNNHINFKIFSAEILEKEIEYFECDNCGYVLTEEPTWLNKAYTNPINYSDTGIMSRNLLSIPLVMATLTLIRHRKSTLVDYAGGHGFLVRLLRDIGIDAFWADPYSKNLVARGFEYKNNDNAKLVTAFESFEHFVRPCEEMDKLLKIAPNILLTTTIIPRPTPKPSDWWYYGLDHGQHIGFYRIQTLQYIAKRFDLNLISDGIQTHFFSKQKYSYQAWRILIILANRFPKLFSVGMKSKTWDDHLYVSKNSQKFNL
tara:strand:- start:87 stop:872 length:786 start_codon:yes stop_codon:yes gene_type:complete